MRSTGERAGGNGRPTRDLAKSDCLGHRSRSLKQFLGEGTPSWDFDALVTADAAYDKQISELIRRANNEGWIGDLVDTVLEARKGNARFVAAVGPIADQIKKDGELPPDEAPEGRIPTPSPLIWIVLSLLIIVAAVATKALSEELPVWLIPAVIVALLFLALGITTLIPPRQRALVDLYATDQSLIKGIGVSGLVLLLALAVSGFTPAARRGHGSSNTQRRCQMPTRMLRCRFWSLNWKVMIKGDRKLNT